MKKKIIKFLEIEELEDLKRPLFERYQIAINKLAKRRKMLPKDIIAIRDYTAITFIYACALRVSELCKLKMHNLDLENNKMIVVDGKTGDRIVPIPLPVVELLKQWLSVRPNIGENNYVFHNVKHSNKCKNNDRPMNRTYWNLLLNKLSIESGITLKGGDKILRPHPHTLRHSRAMALRDNNVPLDIIQNLLGHSSINTTATQYLTVRESKVNEAQQNVLVGI